MKINKAEYELSGVNMEQYPNDGWPEIALAGRSNVGKSSLINKFTNRKKLAYISSKPGKTQTLNFFNINDRFYFVDLPGYGFAKVSKKKRGEWGEMIKEYLDNREQLAGIIQVVDMRHPPSEEDIQMMQWIEHNNLPGLVVATKADKVARGKWQKHLNIIKENISSRENLPIVIFSAETGAGKDELSKNLEEMLSIT